MAIWKGFQASWNIFENEPKKLHAESIYDVYNRVIDFFSEINMDEDILIVTHSGTILIIKVYMINKNMIKIIVILK